jgi:purine-binding chemotaxis protein CheW
MSEFDTQKGKYVTFRSGKEYYGLKIQYVNEIIVFQEITEVPETADYVKGLINLRGKIIPVVDVRLRFQQEPVPYTDRTCIIVIQYESTVVGLIVEKIAEVVEIPEENVLPAPTMGRKDQGDNRFISGIGKVGDDVKLLLDPARLLQYEDMAVLDKLDEETGKGEENE